MNPRLTKHARMRFKQRSGIGPIRQWEVPIFFEEARRCTKREIKRYTNESGNLYIHDNLRLVAVVRDGQVVTFLRVKRKPTRKGKQSGAVRYNRRWQENTG